MFDAYVANRPAFAALDAPPPRAKTVNLALQERGAHAAFSWGVLDRLLEEEQIGFEAVSAAGAGALNAVALAYGLTLGGREGAREVLDDVWSHIASVGLKALSRRDAIARVLETHIDFQELRRGCAVSLFIPVGEPASSRMRVFDDRTVSAEITARCAVELDAEDAPPPRPPMFPLVYGRLSRDVLVLQGAPIACDDPGGNAMAHMGDMGFDPAMLRGMRAIALFAQMIDAGDACAGALRPVRAHAIEPEEGLSEPRRAGLRGSSWELLIALREAGRRRADDWLANNFDLIGVRATLDISPLLH